MPGSSTQSGIDLQSLSQRDDTFEPKVTGKWIVWSEEQYACYVFKVRRYLYRLPSSKLNQDEIKRLMQDYKLLMFVNLAMTHLEAMPKQSLKGIENLKVLEPSTSQGESR
jgi:hypothetical protein